MEQKKLLILGGSRYIIPVIDIAHKLDIYVITADYLPGNIAHKYSDKYINVSIIEKEKVLAISREMKIDGIMSFACDPGVVTAAYVAECLGIPFQCSFESAKIFQNKGLFREFLKKNGFNVPYAKSYFKKQQALEDCDKFQWPVIVKPVDSAGSKGVSKVENQDDLESAIELALNFSFSKVFIVEEFLTFEGFHSSADPFTVDGKIQFMTFSDQLFDENSENKYAPVKIIWPSTMKLENQIYLTEEIQRLMNLLHVKTGIYNVETCVGIDGKPYIMEVSPRGGGCKIAEIQNLAYDVNLIENEIRSAVGFPILSIKQKKCKGVWCEYVIHAQKKGVFKGLNIREDMRKYVKVVDLTVREGDVVMPFSGANMSLGDIFFKFENRQELDNIMSNVEEWLKIELE